MSRKNTIIVLVVCIIGALGIVILPHLRVRTESASVTPANTTRCATKTFGEGSSGVCVSDAKALVNYIENSGLNECPFTNGKVLDDTDTFDAAMTVQIISVQTWTNCYNRQEGSNDRLQVSGTIDSTTWATLCSYGYKFAKQSQSSTSHYRAAAITAGKSAGCD